MGKGFQKLICPSIRGFNSFNIRLVLPVPEIFLINFMAVVIVVWRLPWKSYHCHFKLNLLVSLYCWILVLIIKTMFLLKISLFIWAFEMPALRIWVSDFFFVEPFYGTICLYNRERREKLSEDFIFHILPTEMQEVSCFCFAFLFLGFHFFVPLVSFDVSVL